MLDLAFLSLATDQIAIWENVDKIDLPKVRVGTCRADRSLRNSTMHSRRVSLTIKPLRAKCQDPGRAR